MFAAGAGQKQCPPNVESGIMTILASVSAAALDKRSSGDAPKTVVGKATAVITHFSVVAVIPTSATAS
jgi:hypothetical protein